MAAAAALLSGCATSRSASDVNGDRLVAPQSQAERAYLGLSSDVSTFRLEDIRCEVLVVDCFDMYCHVCQTGARHINELYGLAQARGLGERVKFIGLGIGDTAFEVATYKDKFKVPFPLFPDRRTLIARTLGEVKLPNLLVLRNRSGRLEVLHRSPGVLLDGAKLLSQIQADLTQARPPHWSDTLQAAQPTCEERSTACRDTAASHDAGVNPPPRSR